MDTFMDKLSQRFTAQEMIKANSAAETEEMNRLKYQVQEYGDCLNRMQSVCSMVQQTADDARSKIDAAQVNTDELREQLLDIKEAMQATKQDTAQLENMKNLIVAQQGDMQNILAEQQDDMKVLMAEQQSGMKGLLEEQQSGMKGLLEEQQSGMKGLLAEQQSGVKGLLDNQLDDMKDLMKTQMGGMKTAQDAQFGSMRGTLESQVQEMMSALEMQINNSNEFVHKECVKVYRNVQAAVADENSKIKDGWDDSLKSIKSKVEKTFYMALAALALSAVGVLLQILGLLHIL